ncbi:hypothetical protein MTR67_021109 [Solanum verrucosum]|nr:hypothetical protein MTR67_021109 [Solanum verrucosum]
MLYIIGLGLGDDKDITLKGLEAVKKCSKVYMEAYTSLLSFGLSPNGLSNLENLYGRSITLADREMVEEKADEILNEAKSSDVAFLVVGDPFGLVWGSMAPVAVSPLVSAELAAFCLVSCLAVYVATLCVLCFDVLSLIYFLFSPSYVNFQYRATTHTDIVVRAKKLGVDVKVIHNASVMNAVGVCGLQLYHYGETVSIPFFTETWRPDSFYEKIRENRKLGLHTLCLLDIRVKEPTIESLCRGKKQYEPPRFMTVNTAIEQLLEVEEARGESVYGENTICVGFARLGSEDQKVVAGSMKQLLTVDFGPPLHCLVIVGKTHPVEEEMLEFYGL